MKRFCMLLLLLMLLTVGCPALFCSCQKNESTEEPLFLYESPTDVTEVPDEPYPERGSIKLSATDMKEKYPKEENFELHFWLQTLDLADIDSYTYESEGLTVLSATQTDGNIDLVVRRNSEAQLVNLTVHAVAKQGDEASQSIYGISYREGLFISLNYESACSGYLSYLQKKNLITEYVRSRTDFTLSSKTPEELANIKVTYHALEIVSSHWLWFWLAIFSIVCVIAKYLFIFLRRRKRKERQ